MKISNGRASLLLVALTALPAAGQEVGVNQLDQLAEEALRADDLSGGDFFEVVRNPEGRVLSVFGRYDVGLAAETLNASAIESALGAFNRSHSGLYREQLAEIKCRDVQPVDDKTTVARCIQLVDGLRVVDADVTASFWSDGALQSFNGRLLNSSSGAPRAMGLDEALSLFMDDGLLGNDDAQALVFDGQAWTSGSSSVEEVFADLEGGPAWRLYTPEVEALLDEDAKIVVKAHDHLDHNTGPCNVTRRNFFRTGGGVATTILNEDTSEPLLSEQITCQADDTFGSCNWQLRREPFGFSHGISRVTDNDGAEQEVVQACSSSAVPQFTGTNGDSLREQGAFYVENQMRFFTDQNAWAGVAPDQDSNVKITVDNTGVSTAAFSDFTTDIDCNATCGFGTTGCCAQDVLSHEYGHYVVWTYGDVSDNCTAGTDEGDSLDETMANAFGMNFWLDDDESGFVFYRAMAGFALNNGPAAHTSSTNIITAAPSCPGPNDPTDGAAFLQAVWELEFNRDCVNQTCAVNSGFSSFIWTSLNQEQVLTRVGNAMGFALSILGTNITHQQVRGAMRLRIISDADTATGSRAQHVFSHHGMTCPSCCTGC